jgi:hypothetical protein
VSNAALSAALWTAIEARDWAAVEALADPALAATFPPGGPARKDRQVS